MARTRTSRAQTPAKPAGRAAKRSAKPSAKPSAGPARRRIRWAAIAKWGLTGTIWAALVLLVVVGWYAYDLPDVDEAMSAERRPAVRLLAADGAPIAVFGDLQAGPVRLTDMPAALPQAVLATEDRRFYDHFGLDLIGLARAMVANLRAGRIVQGGSTLTQQLAKNLFLSPDRTIRRKVQELLLALWLEQRFTKDQILTLYLNRVYLGAGTYGVAAAARRYFDKPVGRLGVYESAMLAGLLKAPSRYNPRADARRAAERTRVVIANMVAAGYLSEDQAAAALRGERVVAGRAARPGRFGRHFADWALEQASGFAGAPGADMEVATTLDPRLQAAAERRLQAMLAGPGRTAGVTQAALVVMTPDGAVRAMVGGRDYAASQFNRAVQALRQPGSAFKPLVYLAGLESGLSPRSVLPDEPVRIGTWAPGNYDGRFRGPVTLADALAGSVNTVAVRVSERAGRERVVEVARRLGLTAPLEPRPSIALGSEEVSLLELTAAYAAFANGGLAVVPFGIEAVRAAEGGTIYRHRPVASRAIEPAHVAALNAMLSGVIEAGTGKGAALARPAAGKTGTSQDFRDAWFVGFTADYVAGVWLGNDDGRPMKRVGGGGLPATLWRAVMTDAHGGLAPRPLAGLGTPVRPTPPPPADGDGAGVLDRFMRSIFPGG